MFYIFLFIGNVIEVYDSNPTILDKYGRYMAIGGIVITLMICISFTVLVLAICVTTQRGRTMMLTCIGCCGIPNLLRRIKRLMISVVNGQYMQIDVQPLII